MVPDKLTKWLDKPVKPWKPSEGKPDYANNIYRIGFDWEDGIMLSESLPKFLEGEGVEETIGLSLGADSEECSNFYNEAKLLIEHKAKLPKLKGLFLGECDQDESEISWITQGDLGSYLKNFPALEDLRARGGGTQFSAGRHACLKKLVIESGGLSTKALEGILGSVFPELEHLEIWLGTDDYGWTGNAEDVKPFLYNNPFPKLKYLGLKNCDHQDEIAQLAAEAPILDQLETLDLSLGTLKDKGGTALLQSEKVKQLKKLDLHHHYMSKELIGKFKASDLNVDVSGREDADNYGDEVYYYVSVGE